MDRDEVTLSTEHSGVEEIWNKYRSLETLLKEAFSQVDERVRRRFQHTVSIEGQTAVITITFPDADEAYIFVEYVDC